MKKIIIFLCAICIFTEIDGQENTVKEKQELLDLLSSKHDYERILYLRNKNVASFKSKYTDSYAKIKGNKRKVISYIDNALKVDEVVLSKKFVFYKHESPVSSNIDVNNRISLLTYFKIVKYSLESSKDILPSLLVQ